MSLNATDPSLGILLPDPKTMAIGITSIPSPIRDTVIGSWLNWMLMGTLIVQTYFYQTHFSNDRSLIRGLVYSVVALDVAQTVVGSHAVWRHTVAKWNEPSSLFEFTWSIAVLVTFAGFISVIVQLFYCWRIWILAANNLWMRGMALVIVLISLSQAAVGIVSSIVFQLHASQEQLLKYHPQFTYTISGGFLADTLITGSMIYILRNARNSQGTFNHMGGTLDRLINNALQTGFVTMTCAAVDLALFVTVTTANYHYTPTFILGKLYSNSLLATLNARSRVGKNTAAEDSLYLPNAGSMSLQVARAVESSTDEDTLTHSRKRGKVGPWGS
ncbi:hypothetical protein D9613_009878 [Agrocybe pediades]|uniref:DUF6534 domain-containing protein n=1 Tax=Agrocybe pediades TaxID=84607 RepID=A0A8H4VSH8_9AGAR|nr:hypothetical protein D9613_009878 [Agrocybe pediades]